MEWLIGIYLAVGVFKTLGRMGNPNPGLKPVWMTVERNPIKFVLFFIFHVVAWPLVRK